MSPKQDRKAEQTMTNNYHIITDASADMRADFIGAEDIRIIPMNYTIGGEERVYACEDSQEAIRQFYNAQREGKITMTTQISPQVYVDAFRLFAERGEPVLYLSLSGGLSNTYQSSLMGTQEIKDAFPQAEIYCIDSRSATIGMCLLLEAAAKNRAAGMSIAENAAWLEENRLRVHHWFMVEDLMFLKRGGRVSPTTAIVGSALNIKPILRVEADGTLMNFAKKRGSKAAMNQLVEYYKETSTGGAGERVCIVHADNPDAADYLEAEIKKLNPESDISKSLLSPIIGCHVGPGMCAITHIGKAECARK